MTQAKTFAGSVTAWVRAGYPTDAANGNIALLALCGSELPDSHIVRIADELRRRPIDEITDVDISVAFMTATDRLPGPVEVERLRVLLANGDGRVAGRDS